MANQAETWQRHYLGQDLSSKYRNLVVLATISVFYFEKLENKDPESEKTKTLQ